MAKRGRRLTCTAELTAEICELLSEGHFASTVCTYVGINESTYYRWIAEAKAFDDMDESDFELMSVDDNLKRQLVCNFRESVEKAQSAAEMDAVKLIKADPSWQSKAWYLERTRPHRWGRRTQLSGPYDENDKPTGVPVDVKGAVLGFLHEVHDQLENDGIIETDLTKGNE